MSEVTYSQARNQLQNVLQESVFHQKKQTSWWQRLWGWVQRHFHLSLPVHALTPIAGTITVLVAGALVVGVVVWIVIRWRTRSWRLIEQKLAANPKVTLADQLEKAIEGQNWTLAIHLLVAMGIQSAQARGWLMDRPYKTARACLREVTASADGQFTVLFEELVRTAEQFVFARKAVDPQVVERLRRQLEQWTKKVSA